MNEAELLFTQVLGCDLFTLQVNRKARLPFDDARFIAQVFRRRIQGEPLQYILNRADFMGLSFAVAPQVFIPRPETEILVETVMKCIQGEDTLPLHRRILDVGTGSGCIAISLAKYLSCVTVDALDISPEALAVAQRNAVDNNVNVNFLQSDLWELLEAKTPIYDCIVSNPPYIPTGDIAGLQQEVLWEPRIALDGGEDGLDFYRKLASEAPSYLKKGGFLVMEIGYNQAASVEKILQESGHFKVGPVVKDYQTIERIIVGRKVA
jgi:release factor glutamine methyltransferase